MGTDTEDKPGGCAKAAGIGCAVLLVVGAVAGFMGYRWMNTTGRQVGADAVKQVTTEMINGSQLAQDEKKRLLARINQLVDDFKAERITMEDLGRVAQRLSESPLVPLAGIASVEEQYIKPSELSAEQKERASLQLNRFARGVFERKIPNEKLQTALDTITTKDAKGNRQFRQNVSTKELEAFIGQLKQAADAAGISNEKLDVDVAGEIEKAIDDALKQK